MEEKNYGEKEIINMQIQNISNQTVFDPVLFYVAEGEI